MRRCCLYLLLTIVFVACRKEPRIDSTENNNIDKLTGIYKGIWADYKYNTDKKTTLLHIDSIQQLVRIQQSTVPQAILIDSTVSAYASAKLNEYEEFVLFQSSLCNGTEQYKVIFNQDKEQLIIELEKNSYCPDGKTRIISIFKGSKTKH